jgi:hypothetical protein
LSRSNRLDDLPDVCEHSIAAFCQELAFRGEIQMSRGAINQANSQFQLEFPQALTHR